MAIALTIGGSAKAYRVGSLHLSASANGRTTAAFDVRSNDGTYRPALDAEVIITENATRIFGGLVDRPSESGVLGDKSGAYAGIVTKVSAVDFNAYTERRFVNETLAAGTLKSMLTTLVANYLTGYGVTLDGSQVDGPSLPELIYEYRNLSDVLNELAKLTGKYGDPYVWRIDEFKVLSMGQPASTAAPFDITVASERAVGDITVETTRDKYANTIILKVPDQAFNNYVDTFTGDGSTDTFSTTYPISSHNRFVIVTPGGFYEPLGDGHPTGPTWTIDADNQTLTRLTGALPVGYTATITYDGVLKITATAVDAGEVASVGIWEKVVTIEKVPSDTTAQALADGYLADAVTTPKVIRYQTKGSGLKPGQTQTITIPARNVNAAATITEIITTDYGHGGDVLIHSVTATADAVVQDSWRDVYKLWAGDKAGGDASIALGDGTPSVGGWPAAPVKSVQFNYNGVFGGNEHFTYEYAEDSVLIGTRHTVNGADNLLVGEHHSVG